MPTVETLESADHRGEPMTVYRTRLNVSEPSPETVCSFAFSLEPGAV